MRNRPQLAECDTAKLAEEFGRSGRTQVELADAADCTKQFISKLILGKSTVCSIEIAHAIEGALGVVAGSLFMPRHLSAKQAGPSDHGSQEPMKVAS